MPLYSFSWTLGPAYDAGGARPVIEVGRASISVSVEMNEVKPINGLPLSFCLWLTMWRYERQGIAEILLPSPRNIVVLMSGEAEGRYLTLFVLFRSSPHHMLECFDSEVLVPAVI